MRVVDLNIDEFFDFLKELKDTREIGCITGEDEDGEFCINIVNDEFDYEEQENE